MSQKMRHAIEAALNSTTLQVPGLPPLTVVNSPVIIQGLLPKVAPDKNGFKPLVKEQTQARAQKPKRAKKPKRSKNWGK